MNRPATTATTAKPLPLSERKELLAGMVSSGKLSQSQAALVDLREPTLKERAYAETLLPKARQVLARKKAA